MLGAGGADGASDDESGGVDSSEAADARCFTWSAGAISPHSCGGFILKRGKDSTPAMGEAHLLQLCASYTHANGRRRKRVTTLRMPRLTRPVPVRDLLTALDQQATAALLTRVAVEKAETGAAPPEVRLPPRIAPTGRRAPHAAPCRATAPFHH